MSSESTTAPPKKPHRKHSPFSKFPDSRKNWLRITSIRAIVQTLMVLLFFAFVLTTVLVALPGGDHLQSWVSRFLDIDPLIAISTGLSTRTVYGGLWLALIILVPTFFLGRAFCSWICPFGALHHFFGWVFGRKAAKPRIESNAFRTSSRVKYLILAAVLVAAVFGSLQIGLLDPICLLYRSTTAGLLPIVERPALAPLLDHRLYQGALLIGAIVLTLLLLNIWRPRFFCRTLCPLGALLGVTGRFAWWRIHRDEEKCSNCNRCRLSCEGACDPHSTLRHSECFVCFNCIEDCPDKALSFRLFPPKEGARLNPDVPRRRFVFGAAGGLAFFSLAKATGGSTRNFSSKAIRPPGSVEEQEFLERCLKCDQCMRACPSNVIQPDWFETGVEGLWTPVLNYRIGYCQSECTACGQVCPTGAIQKLTTNDRRGRGAAEGKGPVRVGLAHFDTTRCLPYSQNTPCLVCEEVCPTSPKAIYAVREERPTRHGRLRVHSAGKSWLRLSPDGGHTGTGAVALFEPGSLVGDATHDYRVKVQLADGRVENRKIVRHDADTVELESDLVAAPTAGASVQIVVDLSLPHVDGAQCIGCGFCEYVCPVVGSRRGVHVTAEGETRSHGFTDPDRNRSVRLRG